MTAAKPRRVRSALACTLGARTTWAAAIYLTCVAVVLCAVPLFHALAYPFCLALGVAQVPASLAIGCARTNAGSAARALATTLVRVSLALLPALVVASANAWRVKNCNFARGLCFFLLLPWASAVYGAALAHVTRRVGASAWAQCLALRPRARRQLIVLGLFALALLPLAISLARLYLAPPIFAYDHLWGYYAGSLYDENVMIDRRLLALRASTALRLVALATVATSPVCRRLPVALALCGVCLGLDGLAGPHLGYAVDNAQLARVLPQTVEDQGVRVHLPAGVPAASARALARDHAFRLAQAQARLALAPLPYVVDSYVFATAADKGFWTGAAETMVVKPWLGAMVLHGVAAPHPLLGHEAVHAALAPLGAPGLGLPWQPPVRLGVGLLEGVAEAASAGAGGQVVPATLAARCLLDGEEVRSGRKDRDVGDAGGHLAPVVHRLSGAMGEAGPAFWLQPAGRAYVEAGAFVDWWLQRCGPRALKRAYRRGAWRQACDQAPAPDPALFVAELGQSPVPAANLCAYVRARLLRPSIFARVCPNEIARLKAAQRDVRPPQRVALQRQVVAHLPTAVAERVALAQALLAVATAPARTEALALLDDAAAADDVLLRGQAYDALATAHAQAEAWPLAEAAARAGVALALPDGLGRALWVRAWSLTLAPAERRIVGAYLDGREDLWRAAATLGALAAQGDKVAAYLLGRRLAATEKLAAAAELLAAADPLPYPPLEAERLRLLLALDWQQTAAAMPAFLPPPVRQAALAALAQLGRDAANLVPTAASWADDLRARYAWEADHPLPATR